MQQANQDPISAASPGDQQPLESTPPKSDSAALWRALAGMAISLALACVIVMLEFTSQAAHRADRMRRRAETLFGRVSRLESQIAAQRARLATARRENAAAQALRMLLRAPDAVMLPLAPPAAPVEAVPAHDQHAPGGAVGTRRAGASSRTHATLALAPREGRAVLIVAGLNPPSGDFVYVLWWRTRKDVTVRGAEFRTADDGSALVAAPLPAGVDVTNVSVTAERPDSGVAPANAGQTAVPDSALAGAGDTRAHAAGAAGTFVSGTPTGKVLLRGTIAR